MVVGWAKPLLAPCPTLRSGDCAHEFLARTHRRHRRSKIAGDSGVPADQGSAGIRFRAARTDLALRKTRLPDPRRHSDHAAGRGAEDRVRGTVIPAKAGI